MTTSSLPETLTELNDLCRYFMDAESKIRQGEAVDMSGLDLRVKEICQTVQSSMVDQQQQYLPELTALLGLLSSCEAALLQNPPKDDDHA
ncbi:MAG: hypothetical protein WC612_03925 [Bdellovibrionales bacterium]|jgi:hypothetical protein